MVGRFINKDEVNYLGVNGNIASYNLFTYCENDAINRMDPNGYDAVVLQYKNSAYGMGHISAMVQNSKDDWYYFYWGSSASGMYRIFPAKAYVRLKSLMWKGEFRHLFRNVKTFLTYCDEYNEEPIKYSAGLTDWIYIPGNFADTYNYYEFLQEEAMSDNRIYNLYMFNCKHAVMQGLHFSVYANRQSPLYEIFLKANAIMIPNNAFNYLKRTINSYYLLYMVGYHALTYLSH